MAKKKHPRKTARPARQLDASLPIYQLQIRLLDIEPPIWRRLQTSDCSLDDLHELIQAAFGWEGYHPHVFEIQGEEYSTGCEFGDECIEDAADIFLSHVLENGCYEFLYEYDFGDSWMHRIQIEDTRLAEEGVRYPRCVGGERAAPPEDSGGPFRYPFLLEAIADPENAEDPEILDWLDPDFDPERFDLDDLNAMLLRMRAFLGMGRSHLVPAGKFHEGDLVRVKPAVRHADYADIPLGGWTGTVTGVSFVIPTVYELQWSEATLAAVDEVYFRRCERDDSTPDQYFLDEWQIEAASKQDLLRIEQPTEIQTRPLSPDDAEDRIRMIFGLTTDDALPEITNESEQVYFEFLRARLQFPFQARYWCEESCDFEGPLVVTAISRADTGERDGIVCRMAAGEPHAETALSQMLPDDDDPNCQAIEDYRYWLWDYPKRLSDELLEFQDEEFEDEEGGWDDEDEWDDEDAEDEDSWDDEAGDDGGRERDFHDDSASKESSRRASAPAQYPIGTVAYYGPDDKRTTKIVAGVIWTRDGEPLLKRWVGTDVTTSEKVRREILAFFEQHGVRSIVASDGNIGCPHEEGADFPLGEDCPFCPWWKGKQGTARRE